MSKTITLADIVSNALNKGYTADQAVKDLTTLMNEDTLVELRHGTDSPQHAELRRLTTIQEKLAQAKLVEHPIFDQLGTLKATLHEHE